MPSRQWQQGIILTGKKRKDGSYPYIIIARKTGFMDVWIGNKHYYYNYSEHNVNPNKINIEKVIQDIEAQEQRKRGLIVIRRK